MKEAEIASYFLMIMGSIVIIFYILLLLRRKITLKRIFES